MSPNGDRVELTADSLISSSSRAANGASSPPPSILKTSTSHSSNSALPRTETGSSSLSSSSSRSHRSFVRSILPHSHHKSDPHTRHSHHHHGPASERALHISIPGDPVSLCETFLNVFMTWPAVNTVDELRRDLGPRLFHRGYMHRVNCREYDAEQVWEVVRFFRKKFDSSRVKVKTILMDQDGTATMEQAAVAITYDIIGSKQMGGKHSEPIEVRTSCVGVFKIFEGKLAQADIVADTLPFQLAKESVNKEVACLVM